MTVELGGIAQLALIPAGSLAQTWQRPALLCEPGTWARVTPPRRPPDDQMELAA